MHTAASPRAPPLTAPGPARPRRRFRAPGTWHAGRPGAAAGAARPGRRRNGRARASGHRQALRRSPHRPPIAMLRSPTPPLHALLLIIGSAAAPSIIYHFHRLASTSISSHFHFLDLLLLIFAASRLGGIGRAGRRFRAAMGRGRRAPGPGPAGPGFSYAGRAFIRAIPLPGHQRRAIWLHGSLPSIFAPPPIPLIPARVLCGTIHFRRHHFHQPFTPFPGSGSSFNTPG